jgi:hypothetical protein
LFAGIMSKEPGPRGRYSGGTFTMTAHIYMGQMLGATPDGRKAGEPIADAISSRQGFDKNGPTAYLRSAAKLPHRALTNGRPGARPADEAGADGGAARSAVVTRSVHKPRRAHRRLLDVLRDAQHDHAGRFHTKDRAGYIKQEIPRPAAGGFPLFGTPPCGGGTGYEKRQKKSNPDFVGTVLSALGSSGAFVLFGFYVHVLRFFLRLDQVEHGKAVVLLLHISDSVRDAVEQNQVHPFVVDHSYLQKISSDNRRRASTASGRSVRI